TGTLYAVWKLLFSPRSYLRRVGWWRSYRLRAPVDAEGKPIPWISYPAIEFLASRVQPDWHVFEYGSGNSTLWWAARVERVVSCEHEAAWYRFVESRRPDNVELLLRDAEDGSYERTLADYSRQFDVVVIDGIRRAQCAALAARALKPAGFIVYDNSDKAQFREGAEALEKQGFKRLDFVGPVPGSILSSATSIFYKTRNCAGL
ncbi:MAG: hypothetical protein D6773_16705, partial [Alphaproteobacteria bacterium]